MPKYQPLELCSGWEKMTHFKQTYNMTWSQKRAWFTKVCKELGDHESHLLSFRDHCARLRHEGYEEMRAGCRR